MAIAAETEVFAETVADLLDRFDGIPPNRILLRPPPGTATEADILPALNGSRKRCCELVDGVLVEKAMGYWESKLAGYLVYALNAYVIPRDLGSVTPSDGLVKLLPGLVRAPDVAFARSKNFENEPPLANSIPAIVPELVVEIWSESNSTGEMDRKRREYFAAGVHLLWEVFPKTRTIRVQATGAEPIILTESDELTGGDVLPGLTISLQAMFKMLDAKPTE